jgi:hypothetical protein
MYVNIPFTPRNDDSDVEPFAISVSTTTCSPTPFTLRLVSDKNRYETILSLMLSDKDFADLKAKVLAADEERHAMKVEAYEMLKAEFGAEQTDVTPDQDPEDPYA